MRKSLLSEEQQKEVLKRSALYKSGKTKAYTISEVRKRVKQKAIKLNLYLMFCTYGTGICYKISNLLMLDSSGVSFYVKSI